MVLTSDNFVLHFQFWVYIFPCLIVYSSSLIHAELHDKYALILAHYRLNNPGTPKNDQQGLCVYTCLFVQMSALEFFFSFLFLKQYFVHMLCWFTDIHIKRFNTREINVLNSVYSCLYVCPSVYFSENLFIYRVKNEMERREEFRYRYF